MVTVVRGAELGVSMLDVDVEAGTPCASRVPSLR